MVTTILIITIHTIEVTHVQTSSTTFNHIQLDIRSEHQITKINDRVFQVGNLDNDFFHNFYKIFDVINKGSKFIPCFFNNKFNFYAFCNYIIKEFLNNFNKRVFFYKTQRAELESEEFTLESLEEYETPEDSPIIETIIKKLNLNKRSNIKSPLQHETLELEFEIFKGIYNLEFNKTLNNITFHEFLQIKKFIIEKPFKIVHCDKNVGFGVISHQIYNSFCLKHLNNVSTFQELELNPLEFTQETIKNKLGDLVLSKDMSKRLSRSLILSSYKLGSFNVLPKIHKSEFGTRPIINCINHPTSNISQFIDFVLQPHVKNTPSFIKDSQHLIQKLESLSLDNKNIRLSSLDFESLYSNIDLDDALFVIMNFMKNKISNEHITVIGFYHLIKLLFSNNVFTYDNKFYKQNKGIAMGSKCGPTIANIYLSCLEQSFLQIHKPIFYARYIDDIFCITNLEFNLDLLIYNFDYLKLNAVSSNMVNFLDLNIYFDEITYKIKFSLYIKPTNTFSYLLTSSNHPSFITKNLPKGIFIRIRRICSSIIDYYYFSSMIAIQLKSRNYDYKVVCKMINTIAKLDRNYLLKYKVKSSFKNDCIFLTKLFDFNLISLNKNLYNNLDNLSSHFTSLTNKKFEIINKMQPNIGALTSILFTS